MNYIINSICYACWKLRGCREGFGGVVGCSQGFGHPLFSNTCSVLTWGASCRFVELCFAGFVLGVLQRVSYFIGMAK